MAKTKPASSIVVTTKNPLAQAFGMILRRQRDISGKTSEEIADSVGIGRSYYRLVESGTNNLHTSKAVKLVSAFEGVLGFDGICKIMLAVSLMEVTANKLLQEPAVEPDSGANYIKGLLIGADELSKYDTRLKGLFAKFIEADLFGKAQKLSSDEIEEEIKRCGLLYTLNDFLTEYDNFDKPLIAKHSAFIQNYLKDTPTFYLEYLTDFKNQLLQMPIRVNFTDLWRWEDKHKDSFISMACVVTNPDFITGYDNLRRYKYKHLWAPEYQEALFICNSKERTNIKMKDDFVNNLRKSFVESPHIEDREFMKSFDDMMDKVSFKPFDFEDSFNKEIVDDIKGILTSEQLDIQEKDGSTFYEDTMPGAFWAHTLSNYSVGFFAHCDKKKKRLVEGVGLTLSEVSNKLEIFNRIWLKL